MLILVSLPFMYKVSTPTLQVSFVLFWLARSSQVAGIRRRLYYYYVFITLKMTRKMINLLIISVERDTLRAGGWLVLNCSAQLPATCNCILLLCALDQSILSLPPLCICNHNQSSTHSDGQTTTRTRYTPRATEEANGLAGFDFEDVSRDM